MKGMERAILAKESRGRGFWKELKIKEKEDKGKELTAKGQLASFQLKIFPFPLTFPDFTLTNSLSLQTLSHF